MAYNFNKRREARGGGKRNKYGQVVTLGKNSTIKEEVTGTNAEQDKKVPDRPQKKERTAGQVKGVKQVMGYPIARGPQDSTGDALLIKCIEYQAPTTGLKATKAKGFAGKDGTYEGQKVRAGDVIGVYDKKGNRLGDKQFIGDIKLNNKGASDRQKNAKAIYYITLPIPQDVNDSNVVTWGDDSMNIFQIAAVDAAAGVLGDTKQSFENAKAIIDAGVGRTLGNELGENTAQAITRAIAGEAINKLGQNIRPNSVLGRSTGMILNSNLELLFSGVSLRTFPFSINFSPRNSDESDMVISIIKALKSSMAAKKGAGTSGQGGIFLRAPDVFQLKYIDSNGNQHPFLNRIKDCALTAMTVNYTNSGTYATYDDGTPVSIRMNLTFKELNPIYFEDYEDMVGPGVGY